MNNAKQDIQALMNARSELADEIEKIEELFESLYRDLCIMDNDKVRRQPSTKVANVTKVNGTKRNDDIRTVVANILRESTKPMGEDEIAIRLLQGGYRINLPPEELVRAIYSDAIHLLMSDGVVEAIGERPKRKYRWKV